MEMLFVILNNYFTFKLNPKRSFLMGFCFKILVYIAQRSMFFGPIT
jgi:hypothetical protein